MWLGMCLVRRRVARNFVFVILLVISLVTVKYISSGPGGIPVSVRNRLQSKPNLPESNISPADQDDNVYRRRHSAMMSVCSDVNTARYNVTNREDVVRDHFVVDRKHKVIFCGIEKVGCTFWKRVLQITTGLRPEKNPYDIPGYLAHANRLETFRSLSFDTIMEMASSYTKFVFVRDPYARLFSCYIDKLFAPNSAFFGFRMKIAKLTTARESRPQPLKCAPFITFSQFAKFVIHALRTGDGRDGHFVPMYDHCRPCQLRYDVVGKMENFTTDADYVLKSTKLSDLVEVNLTHTAFDRDVVVDAVNNVYSAREKIQKCMPLVTALKLVWRMCQIRGIIDRDRGMPKSFLHQNVTVGRLEFTEALLTANKFSDPQRSKKNRHEALLEAYRSLSTEDLEAIQALYKPDFDLFGYDIELNELRPNNSIQSGFSYLQVD